MTSLDQYLGLDLSLTSTGFIQLDQEGTLVKKQVFSAPKLKGDDWVAHIDRLTYLVHDIFTAIQPGTRIICIEDLAANPAFMGSAIQLIKMRALLEVKLAQHFLDYGDIFWIAPTSMKKFICGKGNVNKVEIAGAIARRFDIELGNSDLYDAYGLARMAMAFDGYGNPTKEQLKCLTPYQEPKVMV